MGVFFFQAEDGIRDLVRSRGLGDVYKRQIFGYIIFIMNWRRQGWLNLYLHYEFAKIRQKLGPVSYTHLTLPTSDLV